MKGAELHSEHRYVIVIALLRNKNAAELKGTKVAPFIHKRRSINMGICRTNRCNISIQNYQALKWLINGGKNYKPFDVVNKYSPIFWKCEEIADKKTGR